MKTTSFKKFLIPGGLILICLIAFGGISSDFKEALANEVANFDIDGLYAVLGMSAVCVSIYAVINRLMKRDAKAKEETLNYSKERSIPQRTVIKKTA